MKKAPRDKALSYALRLINVRPRSTKEIYERLMGKKFSPGLTNEIISLLKKEGQLDDIKFARLWIESRRNFNPKGELALRHELRKKGISPPVIDKVLDSEKTASDEYETAKELAATKLGTLRNLAAIKQRQKMHDFLLRRGFGFDVIERILEELNDNR